MATEDSCTRATNANDDSRDDDSHRCRHCWMMGTTRTLTSTRGGWFLCILVIQEGEESPTKGGSTQFLGRK
jgi:hypothetical protein